MYCFVPVRAVLCGDAASAWFPSFGSREHVDMLCRLPMMTPTPSLAIWADEPRPRVMDLSTSIHPP